MLTRSLARVARRRYLEWPSDEKLVESTRESPYKCNISLASKIEREIEKEKGGKEKET